MLKRFLQFLSPSKSGHQATGVRQSHACTLNGMSSGATSLCKQLQAKGFEAYLVGGCVRDSLLGATPKDFDVATSATPEQVQQCFRSSRIVGRRFKIVHVRMGREVIEVTTFRGHHSEAAGKEAVQSAAGLLLRDNVYGDLTSDALRRDFTVNALYYDPVAHQLIDFTQGKADLKNRCLRIIGDPAARYREDPVRLLRAARFEAKLGFVLDKASLQPMKTLAPLLKQIPSARLFEEVLKLFLGGSATATFHRLQEHQLLQYLFPEVAPLASASPFNSSLLETVCVHTDKRIRQQKRVTPAYLYAAFLWLPYQARIQQLLSQGKKMGEAAHIAAEQTLHEQYLATAIPKRFVMPLREIWQLQPALERRQASRIEALMTHERFRAAYDFILLREAAGEDLQGLGSWWTRLQETDEAGRAALIENLQAAPAPDKTRRRRRPSTKTSPASPPNTRHE